MTDMGNEQKLILVTGKGGVGKSIISAAYAYKKAKMGHKVLLVELGERSVFKQFFDQKSINYEPQLLRENLWVSQWSGDACLKEYILSLMKIKRVVNLFFDNKVMKTFIKVAPALKELAILGKLTSGIRHYGPSFDFDYVILDAPATGHFKALLNVPRGMADLIKVGPMGEQSRAIHEVLIKHSKILLVTIAEELPITEGVELYDYLQDKYDITAEIILNKWMDLNMTDSEFEILDQELKKTESKESHQALCFSSYLQNIQRRQKFAEEALKETKTHILKVPMDFNIEVQNRVERLSEYLGDL